MDFCVILISENQIQLLEAGLLFQLLYLLPGGLHLVLLGLLGFVHLTVLHLFEYGVLVGSDFRHIVQQQLPEIGAGRFGDIAGVFLYEGPLLIKDIGEKFLLGHSGLVGHSCLLY